MFVKSIVKSSGQWWKLIAAFTGIVFGGATFVLSLMLSDRFPPGLGDMLLGLGLAATLSSLLYACLGITCPSCGDKWVWRAISGKSHSEWTPWLLGLRECPVCGFSNSTRKEIPSNKAL
jgi:predicted RNA-binding Zn-ribbon protein involved in translation (DUF1610 family)